MEISDVFFFGFKLGDQLLLWNTMKVNVCIKLVFFLALKHVVKQFNMRFSYFKWHFYTKAIGFWMCTDKYLV